MKTLGLALLTLIGLSAGGCSVVSLLIFGPFDSILFVIAGLIVVGICFYAVRELSKR